MSDIFLDSARKRLLMAYTTGNIDLIDSDDNVINLPDISESNVAPPLTINRAFFLWIKKNGRRFWSDLRILPVQLCFMKRLIA